MDGAALALLGPGVDVAQTALERVLVEDRGRAGGAVDRRDDVAGLLDRPGRGEPQPWMLLEAINRREEWRVKLAHDRPAPH
jgi:hypothetical protein